MTERILLVHVAIAEVQRMRELDFRGPDDRVRQLLGIYCSDPSLADLLWADLPKSTSVQDISDLLGLWLWRTDDNGSSIMRSVERWIEKNTNEKQVAVALNLEAYPFSDHNNRIIKLKGVAARFPKLAQRCEEMITQSKEWLAREAKLAKA